MLIDTYYREPDRRNFLPGRMWKKVPNRPRNTRIGSPTLLATTFDEKILESLEDVETLNRGGPARTAGLGLTMSANSAFALPPLPFRSMEPVDNSDRPASSVYSQPSPEFQPDFPQDGAPSSVYYEEDNRLPSSTHNDVSPPDSPDQDYSREWRGSPNISPIEEEPSETESEVPKNPRAKSNIPILRAFQNRDGSKTINTGAPTFGWKNKISTKTADGVKWDDYSGEPTDSENGKKPQVKPGTNPLQQIAGATKIPFRFQKGPRDQERESIAERRSKLKSGNSPDTSPVTEQDSGIDEPDTPTVARKPVERKRLPNDDDDDDDDDLTALPHREPWKGASGRVTLVNPVSNTPSARTQPLVIPTKPIRRPVPEIQHQGEKSPSATYKPTGRPRTNDSPRNPSSNDIDHDPIKPIVPLKAGRNSPPSYSPTANSKFRSASSPVAPSPAPLSARSPSSVYSDVNKPLPTPKGAIEHQPKGSENTIKPPTPVSEAEFQSQMQSVKLHDQQSSRFSTTTYATTHCDSPPGTPRMSTDIQAPPMPAMPLSYRPPVSSTPPTRYDPPISKINTPPLSSAPSSILNRKRPVTSQLDHSQTNPYAYTTTIKTTARKPTPSQVSRSSVYSTDGGFGSSKALPASPPELEAHDKVTALQARLENLQRRRFNLQTILKELTQVIQPSSVAYDLASRAEVKKTVQSLENEMADVAKEEHEVGLKLHRAWKKRDEENSWGGGGGLWVRRVTG